MLAYNIPRKLNKFTQAYVIKYRNPSENGLEHDFRFVLSELFKDTMKC